ncbi:response regulator [Sphingosinithalassobacter tenebrarum]|uniref:protein-glutamate methylesterase n=2 Tax=Stakelama tenebrarum TaxID=2711215 RepID=A0A6G6YAE9_9SPHN|nr:response regulator [Sphingosinithalassobacter tenebrarum]
MIVDDSVVARTVLARMLESSGKFVVANAVGNVQAALGFLETQQVDIVLLDIEMPGVDGLTALPDVLAASGGAKVLIVSSTCDDGAAATIQALALGAADTLVKPGIGAFAGKFSEVLHEKVKRLLDAPAEASGAMRGNLAACKVADDFDVVAIGASTGGIHALSQLLREVPPDFQVPILITQHLPGSFMSYFATQLAVLAGRPCEVATDCMRIRPGRLIVAPGDAHLRCVRMSDGTAIRLSHDRVANGCMPSVDPMLASVAQTYGARALAIVLSGMGRDGSEGARAIVQAGGSVVVQDRESSVVWGMPGSVFNAGQASAALSPSDIGRLIASRKRPS